ncbi:MAG: hypothetical protein RL181_840, partial [Bacteroidota bacterium]
MTPATLLVLCLWAGMLPAPEPHALYIG